MRRTLKRNALDPRSWFVVASLAMSFFALPARGADRDPEEHRYGWRVAEGRKHVLWVGGGHWHDTLATAAVMRLVLEGGGRFHVTYAEDTGVLARLQPYDIILLNGMLASIAPEEERGLLGAVRAGKPLLVLHAASASFRRSPPRPPGDPVAAHPEFYEMIGGYVERHPPLGPVRVRVTAPRHPVVEGLGDFEIVDELFLFRNLPADNEVLLETDFEGTKRPLAWTRTWGAGRVLHIALGHGPKAAANPALQRSIAQGLAWLAGLPATGPLVPAK